MTTGLSVETASHYGTYGTYGGDGNRCTPSVLELSLFCAEQTTEEAVNDTPFAMPKHLEFCESLARPITSWVKPVALLHRLKSSSSKSGIPAELHSVVNKKERRKEKMGKPASFNCYWRPTWSPSLSKLVSSVSSLSSMVDFDSFALSAEPAVACKAESSMKDSPSPCQSCFLLADGGSGPNFCYDCADEYINLAYPHGKASRERREHVDPPVRSRENGSSAPDPSEVALSVALSVATVRLNGSTCRRTAGALGTVKAAS